MYPAIVPQEIGAHPEDDVPRSYPIRVLRDAIGLHHDRTEYNTFWIRFGSEAQRQTIPVTLPQLGTLAAEVPIHPLKTEYIPAIEHWFRTKFYFIGDMVGVALKRGRTHDLLSVNIRPYEAGPTSRGTLIHCIPSCLDMIEALQLYDFHIVEYQAGAARFVKWQLEYRTSISVMFYEDAELAPLPLMPPRPVPAVMGTNADL